MTAERKCLIPILTTIFHTSSINCTCLWRTGAVRGASVSWHGVLLLPLSPEASDNRRVTAKSHILNPVCRWTPVVVLNPERLGTAKRRESRVRPIHHQVHIVLLLWITCTEYFCLQYLWYQSSLPEQSGKCCGWEKPHFKAWEREKHLLKYLYIHVSSLPFFTHCYIC